jgi:hypothetical protein
LWAIERDVLPTSNNPEPDFDEQKQLLDDVIDKGKVRAWLVQRLVEHALGIMKQEELENAQSSLSKI